MLNTPDDLLTGKRKGLVGSESTDGAGDDEHAASMAKANDPCRGVIRFKARKLAGGVIHTSVITATEHCCLTSAVVSDDDHV